MMFLFVFAAIAYGAATFAYGHPNASASAKSRAPAIALGVAALMHTATIGAQCVDGNHPFASMGLAMSFAALLAVGGYLVLGARSMAMRGLGAALAPTALVALTLSVVSAPNEAYVSAPPAMLWTHVGLATLGIAGFTLAAGVAAVYLAMDRRLRNKKFKPGGGISLTGLDRMHALMVGFVVPVFMLALVTGSLWLVREQGGSLSDRSIELAAGGAAALASTVSLVGRAIWGLRGRRAAWLTIISFVLTLVVVVSYGVRA